MGKYLSNGLTEDFEKAAVLFLWITDNISYDMDSLLHHKVTHELCKPENVLKSKKSVCSGKFYFKKIKLTVKKLHFLQEIFFLNNINNNKKILYFIVGYSGLFN